MTNAQIKQLKQRVEDAEQHSYELAIEVHRYRELIRPVLEYLSKQWPGSTGSNLRQLQKMVDRA